jgi:DnaJ-class molecular chaperone
MEPDVTYYEELGVERTASAEEIRRAFRKLAQLLHRDQHQDEALRRICERQMARLNGIAEILGDPEQRREYDLGLEEGSVRGAAGADRRALVPGRCRLL